MIMRSVLLVLVVLSVAAASIAAADSEPVKVASDLDRTTIDRVIMKRSRYIRACYEKELTAKPDLEGKVTVKFRIEPDGKTTNVKASGMVPNLNACIVQQFKKLVFPRSASPAGLTYPLVFKHA
jgi:hypothetical protein